MFPRLVALLMVFAVVLVGQVDAAGKRYAIVIGVRKYRATQPLPELPYTENDANDLAAVLKAGGYRVTLMTQAFGRIEGNENLDPQSAFIRDQLDALLTDPFLKEEDIVIVALAGHGVQYEQIDGDQKTPKFYFCPVDADVASVKTANEITERNRLLDLAELYTSLNACKAGGKLLLVDACRNDPSKPSVSRSLASATLPPLPPPPGGIAAFFSCSANQRAFEDKDLKHGVFFHHVIEALKGDADAGTAKHPADGKVSLAELSENVAGETYNYVREKFQGAKQAPELKGEFRLSIPLIEIAVGSAGTATAKLSSPMKSASPAASKTAVDRSATEKPTTIAQPDGPTGRREALFKSADGQQILKVSIKGNEVFCKDEKTGESVWSRQVTGMALDVNIVGSRVIVIDSDDIRAEFDLQKGLALSKETLAKSKPIVRKNVTVKSPADGAALEISADGIVVSCKHGTKGEIWFKVFKKPVIDLKATDINVIVNCTDGSETQLDLVTGENR